MRWKQVWLSAVALTVVEAPDIPGIPAGLATDGPNYLAFLTALRKAMPSGKSMSFAAPAASWYLKQFPIRDMAKQVDYIVYMTYDLHGMTWIPRMYGSVLITPV